MAKRASQTRDARTTDRTSARRLGTEVNICGKRRRWTAEQKRQIVAEGLEPGMSAAMVARKHGISTGQFCGSMMSSGRMVRYAFSARMRSADCSIVSRCPSSQTILRCLASTSAFSSAA